MIERRNPCFGFHEIKQELYIWGGTNDGRNSLSNAIVFDPLSGKTLDKTQDQLIGNERSSCFSAYSDKYGVIMGFGNSVYKGESLLFQDLWQYN